MTMVKYVFTTMVDTVIVIPSKMPNICLDNYCALQWSLQTLFFLPNNIKCIRLGGESSACIVYSLSSLCHNILITHNDYQKLSLLQRSSEESWSIVFPFKVHGILMKKLWKSLLSSSGENRTKLLSFDELLKLSIDMMMLMRKGH